VRFFEFNKSDTDLESAIINVLMNMKGDADERDESSEISMDAVKQIMSNTGYPAFNYDVFKRIYDADGDLKNVVADFDNEKIIIKTDAEAEKDPAMDYDDQGSTDTVKKMARSAMKRRQ
jgi:hypothetical protein